MITENKILIDRINQINSKLWKLITRANAIFGIELPHIAVNFDLRGRSAGQAIRRGYVYTVRFNRDMIMNDGWEHIINETVPHELAHIICFVNPNLGRNHDAGWTRVCRLLGGSGERCHKEVVTYAKGKTYIYTTSTGHTVSMSAIRHRKVQNGGTYICRERGRIDRTCQYSVAA